MANVNMKHKLNVAGKWFTTDPDDDNGEGCIACNVCYTSAPDLFKEDEDGNGYVYKQPETSNEIELMQEQVDSCPVNSIGSNL
jgi:ferredoxin